MIARVSARLNLGVAYLYTIMTHDPFAEMERWFDQTRRAMGPGGRPSLHSGLPGSMGRLSGGDANIGLESTDDGYVVTADLPGFEREDLDLRFDDGGLHVHGAVDLTDDQHGQWHRRRRRVSEHISIPGRVREDEITASYRNGVLEVRLPTAEDPPTDEHRIEID